MKSLKYGRSGRESALTSLQSRGKWKRGLTLVEVLVIIATIAIITVIVLSGTIDIKSRAWRIQCLNNLKEIGLGNRAWSVDGTNFPQNVSGKNGGMMELMHGLNAFRAFQNMSNQLITPKLLYCPSDASRIQATTFNLKPLPGAVPFTSNSNLSYFVGLDATDPQALLSGDRNLTNGTPLKNGVLELAPNKPAGWTAEMHNKVGNILLADGSVQQESAKGLWTTTTNAPLLPNRLLIPVLQ